MTDRGLHPLIGGAVLVATLAALGALGDRTRPPSSTAAPPARMLAPCPPGSLPEGGICVPLPAKPQAGAPAPDDATSERIPRRPDRPEDLAAFTLPLQPGSPPSPEGAGLRLPAPAGTPAFALALEGQEGQAEVVLAGSWPGAGGRGALVTAHRVAEGGRTRTYLVFLVGLEGLAEGLVRGSPAPAGIEVGKVAAGNAGDAGVAGEPGLYLEIRSLREGIRLESVEPPRLADEAVSVATDARNVLPAREAPPSPP